MEGNFREQILGGKILGSKISGWGGGGGENKSGLGSQFFGRKFWGLSLGEENSFFNVLFEGNKIPFSKGSYDKQNLTRVVISYENL